jgi:hypothetical protein
LIREAKNLPLNRRTGGELGHFSDNGWEVGLHGGNEAYDNPVEVRNKKQKIG